MRVSDAIQPGSGGAEPVELVYVEDTGEGIVRRPCGRGFLYLDPSGVRVGDAELLARIRHLAIPPAWRQVWICPDPWGHLQATGRDARGRKQYRYHPHWEQRRDAAKFEGLVRFGASLSAVRRRLQQDRARRGLGRERVLATVVDLLDRTLIRVGNDAYARENASFGLTTMLSRHVELSGSEMRFRFTGKSGRVWNIRLADRRLANVVRSCQELPGQRLFQYLDAEGDLHAVTSGDVNAYLREISGEAITSKHFRTWAGTVFAAALLSAEPPPESKRQAVRTTNAVLDRVAARLGNTRAVCRRSYVHPLVLEGYGAGTLAADIDRAAKRGRRSAAVDEDLLAPAEARVLAWLARQSAAR